MDDADRPRPGSDDDERALEWTGDGGWWAPELDELYDAATLEAIESWARTRVAVEARRVPGDGPTSVPLPPAGRRDLRSMGAGGAMLAAAMLGLADVLEPDKLEPHVAEEAPDPSGDDEPVTFLFVPGDPDASRIIVRPWLL